ncbi:hypothetical protein [Streptomyces sp. NPDC002467]|uniref:hypothetical protein n=1 Tax=Streptomyces sp. NPDC002467 TaxID=3364647 RepID=UPI003677DEE4
MPSWRQPGERGVAEGASAAVGAASSGPAAEFDLEAFAAKAAIIRNEVRVPVS